MTEQRDAEIHHLIGGVLCLDFANTLYGHEEVIHEYLFDYRDLVLWCRHAGILSSQRAAMLLSKWEQLPAKSDTVFRQAIRLRETIFHVFAGLAHGKTPDESYLTELHQNWLKNESHSKLVQMDAGFALGWEERGAMDVMLWPITRSVMGLLTSHELGRVKQCGRCDWLFLDKSRNGKRRWCSMDACGNRVKMARRYKRSKQQN